MAVLWTDIIDPDTLTNYAREAQADYERRQGTLARWLPNRTVANIAVRFLKGRTGLVDEARFRAYDAEIAIGRRLAPKWVTLELPALGQNIPVSEYEQLRATGVEVPEELALGSILNTTRVVVQAVSDAIEQLRGVVLVTGKATVDQEDEFQIDDNFGRSPGHTVTADNLWSDPSVSRIDYLQTLCDLYESANGAPPGAMVGSTRVLRALATGDEFKTQLLNNAERPATEQQVRDTIASAGLPDFVRYNRRTKSGRVIPDDRILLLPEPVEPDAWEETELGATWWGRTLTSMASDWDIAEEDRPGIVTGVYRNPKPPMGIEVIADAIGMPVLANADLSLAAKVL